MKKIFLTILSIITLSFNGAAQCGSLTTPRVYANQMGFECPYTPTMFFISYDGGGTNPTFKFYSGNFSMQLTPSQYSFFNDILMISDPNLIMFTIEMISSEPCTNPHNAVTQVNILRLPKLPYNNSSGNICATDELKLTITPNKSSQSMKPMFPGLTYSDFKWYKDEILISGATDSIYTPTTSGEYYMTYKYSTNTKNGYCNTSLYFVHINDCTPFSTSISGLNSISPGQQNIVYDIPNQTGFTYTWSITGGTIVSGQNTNSVTVDWDVSGLYSISVIEKNQANQTKTITQTINTISTSTILSQAQAGIKLYPNPTTDEFYIKMPESAILVSYEILDIAGHSITNGTFFSTEVNQKIDIDLSTGVYQVILKYNDIVTSARLSKIK